MSQSTTLAGYENGTIFDTSNATIAQQAGMYEIGKAYTPISFIVGSGATITGFDNAVIGMKINETKNVTLTPGPGIRSI